MPAWTTITNALVAVGAKPFATTIQALRDNPIAIAEGATGAPKVVGAALDVILPSVDTSGTTWGKWTGLDLATWIEINGHGVGGSATTNLRMRLSSDGGSTWSAEATVVIFPSSSQTPFRVLINIKTGAYRSSGPSFRSGTLAFTGSPNALGIRVDIGSGSQFADAKILGGVP